MRTSKPLDKERTNMLYQLYDACAIWSKLTNAGVRMARACVQPVAGAGFAFLAIADACLEAADRTTRTYPTRSLDPPVREEVFLSKPFCTLLRFPEANRNAPRILLFPPMSGHGATLLRGNVSAL